jgi:hypothetical protein
VRALALAALLVAAPAAAHTPSSPLAVRVELEPRAAGVHVQLRLTGAPARELVEQLDADASGALDAGERARLVDVLEPRVRRAVRLEVGGQPRPLRAVSRQLDLAGDEVFLAVELGARGAMRGELLLAVDWPEPRAITPVVVRARGVELPAGFRGGEASRGAPLRFSVR